MTPRIVLLAAALALAAAAAPAQSPPPAAPPAAEWEAFGEQLERIADLLERHLQGRKLDLLTRRLEVATLRMAPLQEELARARGNREGLAAERAELDERIESTADQISSGALDVPPEQVEMFSAEMERRLGRVIAQMRELDDRIAQLEVELAERQRELDDWQDYFDRELSGL